MASLLPILQETTAQPQLSGTASRRWCAADVSAAEYFHCWLAAAQAQQ
jgi:hypothetical protein